MQKTVIGKTLFVMKLTFALLTVAFIQVHAAGLAQNVSIVGRAIPMKKVFSDIEKQTGYVVFCNREVMALTKPVTIHAVQTPLAELLSAILKGQPVDFLIRDKTIVLFEKKSPPQPLPAIDSSQLLPPVSGLVSILNVLPKASFASKPKSSCILFTSILIIVYVWC